MSPNQFLKVRVNYEVMILKFIDALMTLVE